MPLSKGDRLGPYEILTLVGQGGMGEVYRAHDDRLRRDVAIKVSNAQFTERFTQEARAIAALNHTNICHLYDVGPNYLVMEYVEGEDLKGPLDFNDALPIIDQLIDGIEAAHEKNIVHRDLKPANIKITPEGIVKILDFGLAKAMDPNPPGAGNAENSPTLTMGATAVGTILGTASYMAPEQAKGKQADKRSDVWSFGVILYELLTGTKMFPGETAVEILGGVLNKDPEIAAAPMRVQRLLRWCLEKDRKRRLASISDARRLLGEDDVAASSQSQLETESQRQWAWMALTAVLALAFAGLAFLHFREKPPETPLINTTLLPPEGGTFALSNYALPAISPDGKRVVFGARTANGKAQQLWVRRLDSPTAQLLPGTEGGLGPFWSPDSRYVGFAQDQSLKKIDIQGGPPVMVASAVGNMRGGAWNADGVILYANNDPTATVYRVSSAGGTPVKASTADASDLNGHRYPVFLPDQKHFLYTAPSSQVPFPVRAGSLDEPEKPGKEVARAYSNAMYAGGHIFYLRENTLMAQPFDADRLQTTGEAIPLAERVPSFSLPARDAAFAVSSSGLLVYQAGVDSGGTRLIWVDRTGKELGSLGEPVQSAVGLQLSPDGKTLLAALQEAGQQHDLWTYDLARQVRTRFTFDLGPDREPVYTPDGAAIVWTSVRGKAFDLYRKASNGTGSDELLYSDPVTKTPSSISPDGKVLLYEAPDPSPHKVNSSDRDIWALPLTPERPGEALKPRPLIQTSFDERRAQFSPDGKWVAYDSRESGQPQVYVVPYPGPGGKRQISLEAAIGARWRHDGKEIYYISSQGDVMAAEVAVRNGTLEVGKVQKLFGGIDITRSYSYVPTADGQKFLVANGSAATAQPLTLVQNWMALLRK